MCVCVGGGGGGGEYSGSHLSCHLSCSPLLMVEYIHGSVGSVSIYGL